MRRVHPTTLAVMLAAFAPAWRALAYLWTYRLNLPLSDTLFRNLPIAVAVHNGTLTPPDMLEQYAGHIGFFSYALTALLAPSGWQAIAEPFVVWGLAAGFVGLTVWLVRREDCTAALLVAVPVSALAFSLRARFNWHVSYSGVAWALMNLWLLGGLALAFIAPRRALGLVALCGLCAAFTHGQGFIVAWVLAAGIWLAGRGWVALALATAWAAGLTWLYISVGGVETSGEGGLLTAFDPLAMTAFLLAYLGAPVSGVGVTATATAAGVGGLALLFGNGVYLLGTAHRRAVWLWWCVAAYPILTGGVVGLARIGVYLEPWKETQYITATGTFWTAAAALSVLSLRQAWAEDGPRPVAWANIGAGVLVTALFVPANYNTTIPRTDFRYVTEACHWRLALTQDIQGTIEADCQLIENPTEINVLAYYNFGMFAEATPLHILPEDYAPGEPVVVAGENGWATYHIARWLLADVSAADLHHLTRFPAQDFPAFDVTLSPANSHATPDDLLRELYGFNRFWVVGGENRPSLPTEWASRYTTQQIVYTSPEGVTIYVVQYRRSDLSDVLSES